MNNGITIKNILKYIANYLLMKVFKVTKCYNPRRFKDEVTNLTNNRHMGKYFLKKSDDRKEYVV